MGREKNYSVEFWRFAFAALICVYHLEGIYSHKYGVEKYFAVGYIGVEFFFILSGFLLAMSSDKKGIGQLTVAEAGDLSWTYVKKKFKTILPRFFVVAVMVIFFVGQEPLIDKVNKFMNLEWDLFFLQVTSVGRENTLFGFMWYVSALVITGYFLTFFLSWKRPFTLYILIPVACLWGYSFFGFHAASLNETRESFGLLASGTIRGFAGLSLGVISYYIYKKALDMQITKPKLVLLNLLEVYAMYRIFILIFNQPADANNFRLLFYFPIIIILSFLNVTFVSRLLNNKASKYLGSLSLSMFLIHQGIRNPFLKAINAPHGRIIDCSLFICFVMLLSALMELAFKYAPRLYHHAKKKVV